MAASFSGIGGGGVVCYCCSSNERAATIGSSRPQQKTKHFTFRHQCSRKVNWGFCELHIAAFEGEVKDRSCATVAVFLGNRHPVPTANQSSSVVLLPA